MIKTTRCHFTENPFNSNEKSLEDTINEIGIDNIKHITSDYYGNGEVGYTIIYDNKELLEQ